MTELNQQNVGHSGAVAQDHGLDARNGGPDRTNSRLNELILDTEFEYDRPGRDAAPRARARRTLERAGGA